ncbi:MAG: DUF3467 domain-containing protein [Actinobacteria bacterium]|uniref:Unannotated protein n=1 Tax=freshwater metagenome TaxID=449393 RepID=A0A6J7M1V9_9ZZZZ|nr:DUF3467 domain-containing protein [Actinomycetota bacterium]
MQDVRLEVSIELPPDQEVGVSADAASVWLTPEAFVIDFLAHRRAPVVDGDEANVVVTHDMVVSSRVRIPPTHVIELMKALERELSSWETLTGNRLPANPPDAT